MESRLLTVRQRLFLGFGAVLLILLGVTLLAVVKVTRIDDALRANAEMHGAIQRFAINFRGSAHDRAIAVRDVVLAGDAASRGQEKAEIERLARFYAESAAPLEKLLASPGAAPELRRLYADIQAIERQSVALSERTVRLVEAGDDEAAQRLLWTEVKPAYVAWLAAINRLIDFEEAAIQRGTGVARSEAGSFLPVMFGALALALAAGLGLAWWLAGTLQRQLGAEPDALRAAAQRVADGDLSPVPGAHAAPAGSVMASLGGMQRALSGVVGRVRDASGAIATGTQQIASGNADLSARTESQAGSLQQTAASMRQLAQSVQANADSAAQADAMAVQAARSAEQGGQRVGDVVATMQDIAESSRRIADIIGTIDGIAFQTNILALNAAVEAARAGDQGRGFAVVAGEVRNLAQRSAEAAREIKTLISASMEKVEAGSQRVGEAGASVQDIVTQVREVSSIIGRIAQATQVQRQGIGEVDQAVAMLDNTTQHNAALVAQSASASRTLHEQASDLASTVQVFRLAGA
jgi:methyl-accepting chemotaxis protein